MSRSIRRRLVAFTIAALLAAPSTAFASNSLDSTEARPAPPMVDVIFMRPLGLAMLGVGAALFIPMGAITAATRPSELGMTYETMVKKPARFVFSDPIGTH